MEYKAIFAAIIGLILLIWPNFDVRRSEKSHANRVNELNAGVGERYFEERSVGKPIHQDAVAFGGGCLVKP